MDTLAMFWRALVFMLLLYVIVTAVVLAAADVVGIIWRRIDRRRQSKEKNDG